MAKNYDKMTLIELERENQRLDRALYETREEKRAVSRAMDQLIHRQNAESRWGEMSMEERMAMRDIVKEA